LIDLVILNIDHQSIKKYSRSVLEVHTVPKGQYEEFTIDLSISLDPMLTASVGWVWGAQAVPVGLASKTIASSRLEGSPARELIP
jgi:hypothetical protein